MPNPAPVKDSSKPALKLTPPEEAAASALDIAAIPSDELAALIVRAQEELASRHQRKRAEFLANVREQAAALGLDADEVAAAVGRKARSPSTTDRRSSVAPKYRNPADATETWSGRGVKPKWLQELLDAGRKLEDFVIAAG